MDTVQVIYNVFEQAPEDELLAACERNDVGVIARVPLDEGALTGTLTADSTFPEGDGYGAWGIGGKQWIGASDEESCARSTARSTSALNFIDTALAYGEGHSERLVGKVVRERAETVYVATKVPPKNRTWPARPGAHVADAFPADHMRAVHGEEPREPGRGDDRPAAAPRLAGRLGRARATGWRRSRR